MKEHELGLSTPLAVLDLLLIAGKDPVPSLVRMARKDFANFPNKATPRVVRFLDKNPN